MCFVCVWVARKLLNPSRAPTLPAGRAGVGSICSLHRYNSHDTLPQDAGYSPLHVPPRSHSGDLFAALLLAWMHHHPGDLAAAVEKAVGGLQAVLADTVRHCGPAGLEAERTAGVGWPLLGVGGS